MESVIQEVTEMVRAANEAHAREKWLAERRRGIGASEVAAIAGVDPRMSPLELYARKVDAMADEDAPHLRWGRRAENLVAEVYSEESRRTILHPEGGPYTIRRNPAVPCLGATLDRRTEDSEEFPALGPERDVITPPAPAVAPYAPLECKVVAGWNASKWIEEPPVEYQVQLQVQMFCTDAQWGVLAALVGWPPRPVWVDVARNDRFLDVIIPRVEEFWQRVIDRDPPPPVPPVASAGAALRALWEVDTGEDIKLPDGTLALVTQWEAAKARRTAFDGQAEELENQLRALMRDATTGLLEDGSSLTLRTTKRKAYTKSYEECTYRTLRRFIPKGRR